MKKTDYSIIWKNKRALSLLFLSIFLLVIQVEGANIGFMNSKGVKINSNDKLCSCTNITYTNVTYTGNISMDYTNIAMTNKTNTFQGDMNVNGTVVIGYNNTASSIYKYGTDSRNHFFVGTTGAFRVQRSSSNSEAFRTQVNGDTEGRWLGTSDGRLKWGAGGSSAQDIELRREKGNQLWLNGSINMTGTLYPESSIRFKTITLPTCNATYDGYLARNATKLYFCDGTIWNGLY